MRQLWRDQFIAEASKAGIRVEDARKLLAKARTLQRLAEAQCNGDYPADNGQRTVKECPACGQLWTPESIKATGGCPDCRAQLAVLRIVQPYGFAASFQGDPRGCVVSIVANGQEIGVPS